tara:strand:+ start:1077 stop:1532 length:456 start_codon:yes stop_codon:yes gene_type:complete
MKTFSIKQKDISKEWLLIDAEGVVLGRLASYISTLLRGKHKTTFTPHMDCGDNVVVINAKKIKLKGKKLKNKVYYRHTGYPGGIKSKTPQNILDSNRPEDLLKMAVKRMLSNNKIARKQMSNLKIFSDENHSLSAQKPRIIPFRDFNRKNI